ncbi:MAG: hypothetical protein AB1347_06925 [Acidobacteriota bacterium]
MGTDQTMDAHGWTPRRRATLILTVGAALAAGGVVGAGISEGWFGPVPGAALAALIGIGTGAAVRRQVLRVRRARSGGGG